MSVIHCFKKKAIFLPLAASLCLASPSLVVANQTSHSLTLPAMTDVQLESIHGGLNEAFIAAASHDPELRAAYMQYQADKEEIVLSKSALLPDISFTAGYSYEDSDNIYTDPDSPSYDETLPRSSGEISETNWMVRLRQPLYDKGRYENYKSVLAFVDQAEYRFLRAEQELVFRVAERYLAVLLSAQQVYLNQQKLVALELKQTQVEREVSLGVGDQLNLLEVTARHDLARADLLQAESALRDEQTRLQNITGKTTVIPDSWIQTGYQVTPELLMGSAEEWLAKANDNLMVKEGEARIKQSKLALKSREAGHYPTVALGLSYQDRDSEDDQRSRKDARITIDLTLPLYQGGKTQAAIRQGSARLSLEEAQRDKTLTDAQQQVKLAYSRLEGFKERLDALNQSSESSLRYLEAAERGQKLNLRSQVEVLDARTRLVDTQLRFAETLNEYLLADIRLHFESGSLSAQRLNEYDEMFSQNSLAAQNQ